LQLAAAAAAAAAANRQQERYLAEKVGEKGASRKARSDQRGPSSSGGDRRRSHSAGRLAHYAACAPAAASGIPRQMSFHENHGAAANVAAAAMAAHALGQWDGGPDCWDWGMGWGWAGWNAVFCGTCAIETAALVNHVPGLSAQVRNANCEVQNPCINITRGLLFAAKVKILLRSLFAREAQKGQKGLERPREERERRGEYTLTVFPMSARQSIEGRKLFSALFRRRMYLLPA